MNDPIMVRRYVREVLALAPKREFTERMLFDAVTRLTRERLTVDEMHAALQWNEARRYVTHRKDDDLEAEVWSLTITGKQKEGLA